MSAKTSPLRVPLTVSKFWKNRRRNESIHVTLSEYEGHDLISVRVYSTGDDGIDRPTTKGVSMGVDKLPALAQGLAKALEKAKELGLVDGTEKADA